MASFPINFLLSGTVPDTTTDGSNPTLYVRRYDNGTVAVTGGDTISVTSGVDSTAMYANGATINF